MPGMMNRGPVVRLERHCSVELDRGLFQIQKATGDISQSKLWVLMMMLFDNRTWFKMFQFRASIIHDLERR